MCHSFTISRREGGRERECVCGVGGGGGGQRLRYLIIKDLVDLLFVILRNFSCGSRPSVCLSPYIYRYR